MIQYRSMYDLSSLRFVPDMMTSGSTIGIAMETVTAPSRYNTNELLFRDCSSDDKAQPHTHGGKGTVHTDPWTVVCLFL